MNKVVKLIPLGILLTSPIEAANYIVTTGTTTNSHGIAAPNGLGFFQSPSNPGVVAIGIFSSFDDDDFEMSPSYVTSFVQFGQAGTFSPAGATGLRNVFTRNTSATVAGSVFSGRNIYVFVGSGTTFANSSEVLVLRTSAQFTDAQDSNPTALTVTLTPASVTVIHGQNVPDVRTTSLDASPTPGWIPTFIPEPSTALLGSLSLIALLCRRRR